MKSFEDPDLMIQIQDELSKDHKGNKKEVMLIFVSACSCRLKPRHRVSTAVRGGTGEGKTNAVKTATKHLPHKAKNNTWFAFGTRFTKATLEDDVVGFPLIVVLEKPKDIDVTEALKQLAEDGMKIWKKDTESEKKQLKDTSYIPRKTVIYTSTENESDEELANRFLIVTIPSNTDRYKKVVYDYSLQCCGLKEETIYDSDEVTWIDKGLRILERFDKIDIPYAPLIPFFTGDARTQRDVKRFFNIVRTIAWLNQKNRIHFEHKGKNILVASLEDFYWAAYLSHDAFIESISGISKPLQRVIDKLKELMETEGCWMQDIDIIKHTFNTEHKWVDRSLLQKELGIKTDNTIRKRITALKHLGVVATHQPYKYGKVYVTLIRELLTHPLITHEYAIIHAWLKAHESEIFNSYLRTVYGLDNNPINNLRVSKLPLVNNIFDDDAINNKVNIPSNTPFNEVISIHYEKLIPYINSRAEAERKKKEIDAVAADIIDIDGDFGV